MARGEDGQARAIASSWGVDVALLEEADWEVDTIDGNDGAIYGYLVRFDEGTDAEVLAQLGLEPGQFTRSISINAFDEPEPDEPERFPRTGGAAFAGSSFADNSFVVSDEAQPPQGTDDGIYSIDEPLPDISDLLDELDQVDGPENPDEGERTYHIDESRYAPTELSRLEPELKIEAMVQWFHENYEDPAVRTPYDSAEGGYEWIWGGPYDAREVIGDQFADIASEDEVEAAVTQVERGGVFWAPAESPSDYDPPEPEGDFKPPQNSLMGIARGLNSQNSSFPTSFFSPGDTTPSAPIDQNAAFQREVTARIEQLEAALETYKTHLPPRNHNRPPELVEPDPIAPADVKLVVEAVIELKVEIKDAAPAPETLQAKASLFRRVAGAIAAWCGQKLDKAVDAGIDWGIPIGLAWITMNPQDVRTALMAVADVVSAWAHYLTIPF